MATAPSGKTTAPGGCELPSSSPSYSSSSRFLILLLLLARRPLPSPAPDAAPLLASALFALPAAAHAAEPITGQWFTKDARAIVTIAPCGSKVCGRITQALKRKPGETGLDAKNPNPALRSRKI